MGPLDSNAAIWVLTEGRPLKLWWYQWVGGVSDRQWNDCYRSLRVQRTRRLDEKRRRADADRNGLRTLLDEAIRLAAG
ncbi:MAG: hypothetical protein H6512_13265 [Acidimicrobiia bacterium]|nr:hypothetical protein [Acidimicrobiia bacterium]